MRYVVKVTSEDLERTRALLNERPGVESATFLLAGRHRIGNRTVLLVRRVVEIPATEYRVRSQIRIELEPSAINGLISLCEANNLTAILAHSHPIDSPYSASDDYGERRIAQTFGDFFPGQILGSLLFTPNRILGRVWPQAGEATPIEEMVVVGRSIEFVPMARIAGADTRTNHRERFDRQIRAFGSAGQANIRRLKVGVVGTSGTGSPLVEQLVRLGVQDLVVIDRKNFDKSNLTRMYGSRYSDAYPSFLRRLFQKAPSKVKIIRRHLLAIEPKLRLKPVAGDVVSGSVAETLLNRDILFACTDEHWGRSILNQIAYQYLIPTINLGIAITSDGQAIESAVGVLDVLRPGNGCLWCSGFLNADRIRAESLPPSERDQLVREGYLVGIDENAPSVISLTTSVGGLAATQFIQLATDFMGAAGEVSRLNYDATLGVVSRGRIAPQPGCVCQMVRAKGDSLVLPTVN